MYAYRARPHHVDLVVPRRRRLRPARALLAAYPRPWRAAANAAYGNAVATLGLLARRGRVYERYPLAWPALIVLRRGGAFIAEQPTEALARAARLALGAGPVLVRAGLPTDIHLELERLALAEVHPDEPLPRSAVGIHGEGHVVLSVWSSTTLPAAADDLVRIGVVHAIALDGGESTALFSSRRGKVRPVVGAAKRKVSSLLVLRRARRVR